MVQLYSSIPENSWALSLPQTGVATLLFWTSIFTRKTNPASAAVGIELLAVNNPPAENNPYAYYATKPAGRSHLSARAKNAHKWSPFLHLSALLGFVIPFANIFMPLFIWLAFRHENHQIDLHGKSALNFQISITIYSILFVGLLFVSLMVWIPKVVISSFFIIYFLFCLVDLFVIIVAAVKASSGKAFTYPISMPFFRMP